MGITRKQYDYLLGFYAHCYAVYHDKSKADFGFWASQLDKANVPWCVQNSVAVTAEEGSMSLYLSTHLANKGVTIH